ncbi:MAG: alpha/beta hydrolase [Devosiaceae bacterium]|nr:alpha/beta hydrolase [Devosiaceae bacterium]
MPDKDLKTLPVPDLPPAQFVGRGYFSIAYYIFEPEPNSAFIPEPDEEEAFCPELEPDYFLEFGYPKADKKPRFPEHQTIVLCHGLAAGALQFVHSARFFTRQGFRVIVPDLRAHGKSSFPQSHTFLENDFTIEAMATDLLAILDKEQVKQTHWVGNSLGGILGLWIMGVQPERINRFVSFGTSYSLDMPAFSVDLMRFATKLIRREHLAQLGARLTCYNNANAQAIIYTLLKNMDINSILRIARHLHRYDLIANAVNFERPILMIQGARDISINSALKNTLVKMATRPNFTLIRMEKTGHCANLDQPEKIHQLMLDFLK